MSVEQGDRRGCGEKGASLGTRHTFKDRPLRKRMGEGIRAQRRTGAWSRRLEPLSEWREPK